MVCVKKIYFSSDGTVNLDLSDKSVLKLDATVWNDLGQPREKLLTESQLEVLQRESTYLKIKNKMISLLALREHSSFELRVKIKERFFKSKNSDMTLLIERSLTEIQELGFQSDERFTKHYVESKLSNKLQGPFKILQDLQNRGISNQLANTVLSELGDQEIWLRKAIDSLEIFSKKSKTLNPVSLSKKLYQRGFSWDTIYQAMEKFQTNSKKGAGGEFRAYFEDILNKVWHPKISL